MKESAALFVVISVAHEAGKPGRIKAKARFAA